jgi:hypothetical protein
MGKKTLDFKGSYDDFFKQKGITLEATNLQNTEPSRIRTSFTMTILPSTQVTIEKDSLFQEACLDAVRVYLTLLGDKTLLKTPSRTFRINW